MVARLEKLYNDTIRDALQKHFGFKSAMRVPKIKKITINMGVGDPGNKKSMEESLADLTRIAGQKPIVTNARKSVAGFKIREGWPLGCKVTLRRQRMYEFLDRLVSVALPRVRDFRGLSVKSFDGRGNYSLGLKEQIVFPEIEFDKADTMRGMDITITTSAQTNEEGIELLKAFNFPLHIKTQDNAAKSEGA